MDNLENEAHAPTELEELQNQCDALHQLVVQILILLVVVSGTLNIYLWRQAQTTGRDLKTFRPFYTNQVASWTSEAGFIKRLQDYGQTDPHFAQVLAKYGLQVQAPAGVAPAATSAPPAATQKK